MKAKSNTVRLLLATTAVGAFASLIYAGPGSAYWRSTKPVTTFSEAKKVGPDDTVTMQCKGCKTVLIRDAKNVGLPNQGRQEWFTVGSKHTCGECKGEITVVKGKTTDSMQHNCSKCGEGAVTCSVAMASPDKK
ncbi:MAG: hypothetical protein JNK23_12825 [Opitutaceae bacterium]|nr:hypothetical protein [Opitutaceae bacterium]